MAYRTRDITFEAGIFWIMVYRKRKLTFKRRFLWLMAYRTKNSAFGARFIWCMAYRSTNIVSEAHFMRFTAYRTSNITNEARSCSLWFIDQGIFKSASCGLRRTEREMLHLKRASCCGTRNITLEARFFLLVLKERGKLHLKLACFVYGLYNEEYYI